MRKPSYLSNALFITGALVAAASCTKDNSVYCDAKRPCAGEAVCAVDTSVCVDSSFSLDRSMFYDDGTTLWSTDAQPTLRGTGAEPNATVQARIDTVVVATATANADGTWAIALPTGTVKITPANLRVETKTADGTVQIGSMFALDTVLPKIEIVPTTTIDEGHDAITFNANAEPAHMHTNFPVVLDGSHCADVVKYGYLLDTEAPLYATENTRNPVTWEIKGEAGVALREKDTRFRITNNAGTPVVDWQPLNLTRAGAAFGATLPITRQLAPAFGAGNDSYKIEWEIVDWAGRMTKASGCWNMRVLAAPLKTAGPTLSTHGPASFGNWRLTNVPPISGAIEGTAPGAFFESPVSNGTAESVEIEASVFAPRVKVTKTAWIADRNVVVGPQLVDGFPCPPGATLPECNATQPVENNFVDSVLEAANSITWKISLLDAADQPVGTCTAPTNGTVRCVMPGRAQGAPPVEARLVASIAKFVDLNPGTGAAAEREFQGFGYTGPAPQLITHCASAVVGNTCRQTVTWQRNTMLGKAIVSVGSISGIGTPAGAGFRLATAPSTGPTTPGTDLITARPIVWDGGGR